MKGTATYGDDNGGGEASVYRYVLTRTDFTVAPAAGAVLLIGLNPSTATAETPDPTITREIDFARRWGFATLLKCNAFGYRATDPEDMKKAIDPVGPQNDAHLRHFANVADLIVICWGNDGAFRQRGYAVRKLLAGHELYCLGKTKTGEPKHPLYLKATTQLERW